MKKKGIVIGVVLGLLILVGYGLWFYLGIGMKMPKEEVLVSEEVAENEKKIVNSVPIEVIEVARNLSVPWSIEFVGKDRMLVSERTGAVKEFVLKETGYEYVGEKYRFNEVKTGAEEGLMGMAAHPGYLRNKWVYFSLAYEEDGLIKVKVVRLLDGEKEMSFDKEILSGIPAAAFHAGSRIKFGPDEKLYVTTGDATDKKLPLDSSSLAGKILRMNDDGSVPLDNPVKGSLVYSSGHRNPQGIDWDVKRRLFSSEHGPSGFDGPAGGDELNMIIPGASYGWPEVSHEKTLQGMIDPLIVWTPAIAPASLLVYKSDLLPQFKVKIFIGGLKGEGIYVVTMKEEKAIKWEKLSEVNVGRVREIAVNSEGEIFFTSSNTDGRGKAVDGDDKIYMIREKKEGVEARFFIRTLGTNRVFSEGKYHNRSKRVYIEASDPSRVVVDADGVTWREFFDSLPLPMKLDENCLITGTNQRFCGDEFTIIYRVNGKEVGIWLDERIKNGEVLEIEVVREK